MLMFSLHSCVLQDFARLAAVLSRGACCSRSRYGFSLLSLSKDFEEVSLKLSSESFFSFRVYLKALLNI